MIAGGSAIISPLGEVLVGPLRGSEGCVSSSGSCCPPPCGARLNSLDNRRADLARAAASLQDPERRDRSGRYHSRQV